MSYQIPCILAGPACPDWFGVAVNFAVARLLSTCIGADASASSVRRGEDQHTTTGIVDKAHRPHQDPYEASGGSRTSGSGMPGRPGHGGFAQNSVLNLDGYSPHMLVTGAMLPYYDLGSPGIQMVSGAEQSPPSIFERQKLSFQRHSALTQRHSSEKQGQTKECSSES